MEQRFLASEKNRQNHVQGVVEKQREREKKAKKVREKSYVELEGNVIHVEETFSNASNSEGMCSTGRVYLSLSINSISEKP